MIAILDVLRWSALACFAGAAGLPAYVGPGAGLSMLGALFSVACVILLALLGAVLYPVRLVRTWFRKRRERILLRAGRGGAGGAWQLIAEASREASQPGASAPSSAAGSAAAWTIAEGSPEPMISADRSR